MKTIPWNLNRATESRRRAWELLEREDPDLACLQEVGRIPARIRECYHCHVPFAAQAWSKTAVLSRGPIDAAPYLASELGWVNRIAADLAGWIAPCRTTLPSGEEYRVISVGVPFWSIAPEQYAGVDVSPIKLRQNPELWYHDILYGLLRDAGISDDANWLVAGDFNSSLLLDEPKPRGNRENIERLGALGLTDCLSHFHGRPVPTFQHASKTVRHQLDYCYVNAPLLDRLQLARVPDQAEVFGPRPRLSDHLPIVCEFK